MKYNSIILLIWLLLPFSSFSQTVYGVNGLVKIPNAYTIENGKIVVGTGYFYDYFRASEPDRHRDHWTFNLNMGFHSRLDLGVRLIGIPSVKPEDSTFQYSYYIDRTVNTKFVVLEEKEKFPQIAIGGQDLVGTKFFNSLYIVSSKRFKINNITLNVTVGHGNKLIGQLTGNVSNYRFIGLFGGITTEFKKLLSVSMEYDAKDINAGITLRHEQWFRFKILTTGFRKIGSAISIKFEL